MELYTEIQFDKNNNCTILTFVGYISGDKYQNAFLQLLDYMLTNSTGNCLLDWTEKGITHNDDLNWLFSTWLPTVKEKAIIQNKLAVNFAILHAKNVFADMTSQKAAKIAIEKFGFHIEYFQDKKDGLKWLSTKKGTV